MSNGRKDDIWVEPTVPDALECPHCHAIIPPHSARCQNCGKEFDWDQARKIYRSRELTRVSGQVVTTSSESKTLIGEIKNDFQDLRSTFSVKQTELLEQRDFSKKLDELEEKIDTIGKQADKIENVVNNIQDTVDNIDDKTEDKTWFEIIRDNVRDNIIGYIIVGLIGALLTIIGFG